jgi:hypothetical protein
MALNLYCVKRLLIGYWILATAWISIRAFFKAISNETG